MQSQWIIDQQLHLFPSLTNLKRVFAYGFKQSGVSIHFVVDSICQHIYQVHLLCGKLQLEPANIKYCS